jgi:endonuclease III related protein
MTTAEQLRNVHERLAAFYDLDRWHWRDESTPYEICLGSILVQHTAWTNVEKALANLRDAGIDSIEKLAALPDDELGALVRPSGTPTVKARRLHAFADLVLSYGGFDGLFVLPSDELRRVLLATPGIGPETADVIMLYAARLPAIVHDAYTTRLMRRLGLGPDGSERYDTWRYWLDGLLPNDAKYRGRHHAAIVVHCKELCRVRPKCAQCPLRDICEYVMHGK